MIQTFSVMKNRTKTAHQMLNQFLKAFKGAVNADLERTA